GPGRRLARGRARRLRDPTAPDRGADVAPRVGRPRRAGAPLAGRRDGRGRHPGRSLLPAAQRGEPPATHHARRSADLARWPEATGPADGRGDGRWLAAARPAPARRGLLRRAPERDPARDGGHRTRPVRLRIRRPGRDRRGRDEPRRGAGGGTRVRQGRCHPHRARAVRAAGSHRVAGRRTGRGRATPRGARMSGTWAAGNRQGHDVAVTERSPGTDETPPDPIRDLPPVTERELAAQRRGLASAYIAGGEDPDPERTRREEARYIRLLVLMVVAIVGGGLLATFVGLIL